MRRWISLSSIAATIVVLSFCSNKPFNGEEPLLKRLVYTLNSQHYQPRKMDDKFSLLMYQNVLDRVDGDKQFFTVQDIKRFEVYKTSIDDQISAGRFDFFDTVWSVMMKRLDQIEPWVVSDLAKPLNYQEKISYEVKEKEDNWSKTDAELKEKWSKWSRFQTVDRLYRKMVNDSAKSYDTLELKSRSETVKLVQDWFKRWRKMDRADQLSFYGNTLAEIYDPHTNYFPPADKDNFDISMTGKLEGIGATLSERDGYIKVERIVPGSASYKQGDLKAGDLILKVAQADEEAVDVVDMKLDDAIQLIRGKKGTVVKLTVKKPDGQIKIIPIIRDVVVIEESYARSFVFEYQSKKFGMIQLPSFYADFAARGRGRNCAGDVHNEIEKLKKLNVDGIVLDLRNNGGGSLADAIEMSGLFVKNGPVVQVKDPQGRIQQAEDPDPNQQYKGPLVVLTNTYSASASEILAAALQDYKRAVIIGSKSTFGKGTVQTMVPLRGEKTAVFPRGFGEVKVTIQKFYRINGGTTQLHGVIPDVIVPDPYDLVERGEKELDFHLDFDQIPAAKYDNYETQRYKLAAAVGKQLVSKEPYFKAVEKRSKEIGESRKSTTYKLDLASYKQQQELLKKQDKAFRDNKYVGKSDTLYALPTDLSEVSGDSTKTTQRTAWFKGYKSDATLDVAAEVLYQWCSYGEKPVVKKPISKSSKVNPSKGK